MKSKQVPLIEKCICLTILSFNSVYKFSKCIYLIAKILLQMNNCYLSEMDVVGFQSEPVSLDKENDTLPNTGGKSRRSKDGVDVGNKE